MKIKHFETLLNIKSACNKNWLLMKLSLSIYLLGCLQLLAINSFSQNKVSLDVKNTQLETIIQLIESQTPYSFIYSNDEINTNQKLDITVFKENLDKTLQLLFKKLSIKYTLKKNHIILSVNKNKTQEKFTLSGTIKDVSTGETLLGATIIIKDKNKGVVTNEYGFYSITLPSDTYTIQVSFIGYTTKNLEVVLDKNIKLDIELKPSDNELEEVLLRSDSQNKSQVRSTLLGVTTMRGADIKKLPALLGEPDITRAILTQPGVSSVGEGATGFNVRGGNIDQNLILLDEAPIYNSSHVWGFFSIFNTDAIKNLKLYKGGIPARFGGRASSVLDIRQREGSNKKFKGEGGLGLLFSRLTLEGPIKKDKMSYLISGRRSYFDLFFPLLGSEVKNTKVYFYDLNTKLAWNINDNNKLFVSGYFGADVMKLNFSEDTTEDDDSESSDESINFNWKNATATVRWNHLFSDRLFMNISGIYSQYNYALSFSDTDGGNSENRSFLFTWKSSIENWIFKPDFTFYQNPTTKFRFGIHNTFYKFNPAEVTTNDQGLNNIKFEAEKDIEIAPYIEYDKQWGKLSVNAGLRFSWFGNIGAYKITEYDPNLPRSVNTITGTREYKKGKIIKSYTGLEPRLSFKYNINDRKAFKLGYNRMFQYLHLISNTTAALPFDIWKPSGTHIKPLEVNQISAGYAYDTSSGNYNFFLEGYYKTFQNMLEYKNGADLFVNENLETQLLPTDGYSYGAEIGIHKNNGKLTGNVNYTYSVTKRKTISSFDTENINGGEFYPSNYDRPHLFNLTANYTLNKKWDLSTFFTYQTGRPTTQPTSKLIVNGISHLTYSDRNAYRIPDTHRMDVSFTYKPTGNPDTRWESSFSFGVYNVYGRKNAFSTYSTFNNEKLKTFQFSVIGSPIPFITYNFKF